MAQFVSINSLNSFPEEWRNVPTHVGIGIYDGMHRGHREIFRRAELAALDDGGIFGALTFEPHPEVFFKGADAIKLIYSRNQKDELFADAGLDFAVHEQFTREFATIEAVDFLPFLKSKIPSLRTIYIGENFHFGAKRAGDSNMLRAEGEKLGISVEIVPPVLFAGTKISSTRIRDALSAGEIHHANAMLSQPYFCTGIVSSGRQLGRTIGFPTLNLCWTPELLPRYGVYAVTLTQKVSSGETEKFRGIANYGVRPTVECGGSVSPVLETHLLDIAPGAHIPTYGDFIKVSWERFIRPEKKFDSLDELVAQISRDKTAAA